MAKRYKPPLTALCKIGTVAHNRPFTTRELREYTGSGDALMRWLKKHKLVRPAISHFNENTGKHAYKRGDPVYPTVKGWKMIEKACHLPKKGR